MGAPPDTTLAMARGKKCPSRRDKGGGHTKPETIHRWAERKLDETGERREQAIDDAVMAGSRYRLALRWARVNGLKAKTWRKEREMLATTSLKDLIK